MKSFLFTALRPLGQIANFRGRSTRTELLSFYFLVMFTAAVAGLLVGPLLRAQFGASAPSFNEIDDLIWLAFLPPLAALIVRRFHDHDKSAWWLLILLPHAALNLRQLALHGWGAWQSNADLPLAIDIPLMLLMAGFYILLLWNDDEGANRYGPNPRYDAPEDARPSTIAGVQSP